tara:strand:- start:1907 stop:2995 length:1089 start_codon:yes stop_codon:yes gene_type:complete
MVFYSAGKVPDYLNPNSNLPKPNAAGSDNRFKSVAPSPAVVAPNPWDTAVTKVGSGNSSRAAAIAAGVNAGNRSSTSGANSTLTVSGAGKTGYSSRAAAIAAGVDGGNRSSTSGSYGGIKVSGANQVTSIGGPENSPTGELSMGPDPTIGGPENDLDLSGPDEDTTTSDPGTTATTPTPEEAEAEGMSQAEYDELLQAAINDILNPQFLDFQGSRAEELRRLQNYRNQLYGQTTEDGREMIGSVGRQETVDLQDRRRLAAQRAASGMLQGGAYAGTERGVGTIQEGRQAYDLQEMQRPFREQIQTDRLNEFGLGYDPTNRGFSLSDFGTPDDIMGGWAEMSGQGPIARRAALKQLLSQGITI